MKPEKIMSFHQNQATAAILVETPEGKIPCPTGQYVGVDDKGQQWVLTREQLVELKRLPPEK